MKKIWHFINLAPDAYVQIEKERWRGLKCKKESCLAPKINKDNSSETEEKPSCGRVVRTAGVGSRIPETQSSAHPSGNTALARCLEGVATRCISALLCLDDLPGTPSSLGRHRRDSQGSLTERCARAGGLLHHPKEMVPCVHPHAALWDFRAVVQIYAERGRLNGVPEGLGLVSP